ncbi:twin-arginine translocation pathway signal protein [Sagittula salina]|uniref:Twin-arginine translocation pathway signal protein n=1 Tax=Sagittula salina TaxID=2820268 RepID=A0A940MSF4_9RHOB|nr:twin-arginine translocation pathway signal protein [Sagittula salina]MBP0484554.1 twin-arginine translocation pathway signal protein [Sagittula salina]
MTGKKTSPTVARRDLLCIAPAVGIAACATPAAAQNDAPEGPPDPRQPRLADTPHTRTYYTLARS